MIPSEKLPAVNRGLQQAFGTTTIEDIQQPIGGLSTALVFRIVVRGAPYLLRIIMRADAQWDPVRHFATMQSASAAGIAPHIYYSSVEDLILITDFITVQPYPADVALRIARTIRTLHALPPFKQTIHYFNVMDCMVRRFHTANLLPESLTAEFFRRYDEVAHVYPRNDADYVSSHNDLKSQNILFDGTRIQFIDWEAAFLNDPYVDLAIAANFFVRSETSADEATEFAYLTEYLGAPPTPYQHARFYLMRQAMHAFYAAFLLLSVAPSITIRPDLAAPAFRDFHTKLISGEIPLTTPHEREQFAKAHLNKFLENAATARFDEALAQVAAAHANA
jgi:Phosphotransferase enzyme family